MKVTKCFAWAITVVALTVGMVSCGPIAQYDPTTDEKNILLDLPSFVQSVEGKTLEEIKEILLNRGYKFKGENEGSVVFVINADNLNIDSLMTSTGEVNMADYLTDKTSILELIMLDEGGVSSAMITYCLPQDSAHIKYTTLHKNAYAFYQSVYPFALDPNEEWIVGYEWEASVMTSEGTNEFTNYLEVSQFLYDNQLITKEEFEEDKEWIESRGYKSYNEFLEAIPESKYIMEIADCYGLNGKEAVYVYDFVAEEMLEEEFPEGIAIAIGGYVGNSDWDTPMKSPDKTKRLENSKALEKLMKMFK